MNYKVTTTSGAVHYFRDECYTLEELTQVLPQMSYITVGDEVMIATAHIEAIERLK